MIHELRPLNRADVPAADAPTLPPLRVASLPGAERRILRKRLEQSRKAKRRNRLAARRAAG